MHTGCGGRGGTAVRPPYLLWACKYVILKAQASVRVNLLGSLLMAHCALQVPSPLASSIFMGAPDSIGQATIDPVPHEHPCAKLANYFFEKDTPPGSPRDINLVSCFSGFSFVQEGELARLENAF